jgi:anti-anti-sigma regulatory factor
MNISVCKDPKTKEVILTLGKRFDISSKSEFHEAYSKFSPSDNFKIDFSAVQDVGDSCFGMLSQG